MPQDIQPPVLAIYGIAAVVLFILAIAPLQVAWRSFFGRPVMWRFDRMIRNRPSSARKIKSDPDYTLAERRIEKLNNAKFITMVILLLAGVLGSLRFPTYYLDPAYKLPGLPKDLDELSAAAVGLGTLLFNAGNKAGLVHMGIGVVAAFVASLLVANLLDYLFAALGYLVDRMLHADDYARTATKPETATKKSKTGKMDGESGKLELPNYYELLSLPQDAPISTLSTLLDAQEQNMQHERASGKGTKKLRRQLDLITEARETLLDQDRRVAYHQALGLKAAEPQRMETLKVRDGGNRTANAREVSDDQRQRMEQMKRMRQGGGGNGEGL
ncbi:MAG: hypothetical protein VKO64_05735 [Candidatus Sericytochromatia bacterium]|nr:hypothetical protein [Candidatus Sericytochromatia bacterium]